MKTVKLGSLVRIFKGKKATSVFDVQEGDRVRFIQIDDLRNDNNLKFTDKNGVFVKSDDVIIAWDGANAGTVGYGLNGIIGSTLAKLEIQNNEIYVNFLGRFLQAKFRYLRDRCTGATIPHISKQVLINLKIPLPPLEDQKRIVKMLDEADVLRQKRKQAIDLLDDYLKSVFLEMFGDPVKNPKKIRKAKIREMGTVFTGNTPPRNILDNYGSFIEWIKSDNINNDNHYLTKATEFLSEIGFKKARIVPAGSVLVTCIAGSLSCIGNVGMADREVGFNQQINAIVPNSDIEQVFLYAQILFNKELFQNASTNSMKGMLNKSKFSEIELLKPDTILQKKYSSLFTKTESLKQRMLAQSEELENQFQALMQKAFKGEL